MELYSQWICVGMKNFRLERFRVNLFISVQTAKYYWFDFLFFFAFRASISSIKIIIIRALLPEMRQGVGMILSNDGIIESNFLSNSTIKS